MKTVAIDIGGTEIKYGVFDETETFGKFAVADSSGKEDVPGSLCDFLRKTAPDRIGISAPGPFDFVGGISHMKQKLHSMYGVSLVDEIKKAGITAEPVFIHDATAFMLGVMEQFPALENEGFVGVMLGTGLGFTESIGGKVLINEKETPLNPLWSKPYKNGICEEYVSATAIKKRAEKIGFENLSVKELADMARGGNEKLQSLFYDVGCDLGEMMNEHNKNRRTIIMGGQVSLSWELMKDGFEKCCSIPLYTVENPTTCAIYGILRALKSGKENCYQREGII